MNLLLAFDAVARQRSFSLAAKNLGKSQATVSIQVRELERQLEVELITRSTRQISLTSAGLHLSEILEPALQSIKSGLISSHEIGIASENRIVIACVPSLAGTLIPEILGRYQVSNNEINKIDIEELASMEMIEAINRPEISFGVGPRMKEPVDGISFLRSGEEPLCVILPKDHVLADYQSLSFAVLTTLPLVTLSGSILLQNELNQLAKQQGITFQSLSEVKQVQTAIAMVKAGVGAAIVPRLALPDIEKGEILIRYVTDPQLYRTIGILTKSGKKLGHSALKISRFIQGSLIKALDGFKAEALPSNFAD